MSRFNFDMINITILAAIRGNIIIFGCRKPGFLTPIFPMRYSAGMKDDNSLAPVRLETFHKALTSVCLMLRGS